MANNKEIAHQILTAVGGASNLKDATHCMTRLRLYLKDDSIPKDEEVKAIGGVLGVVRGGQQYQVIIGTNVPKVYEELCKLANLTANAPVEDAKAAAEDAAVAKPKLTPKQVGKNIMGYMAGCMTPLIPVLLAGALFRCINSLCGPELLELYPAESDLYILFDFLYDAAFYFMPILAGFNAAKQLGITPMLGGFIGCILMVPDFAAYATSGEPFTVFGIPCTVTNYAQTVLPIMLSVFFFSVVYKLIKKIMPDVLTTVFTPFLSMLISIPFILCLLAPLGTIVGNAISNGLAWFGTTTGFFGVAVIAALWEFLVLSGMHLALMMPMMASFFETGIQSGPMVSGSFATWACFGVALGAALRLRNKEEKSTAFCLLHRRHPGRYHRAHPLRHLLPVQPLLHHLRHRRLCGRCLCGHHQCVRLRHHQLQLPGAAQLQWRHHRQPDQRHHRLCHLSGGGCCGYLFLWLLQERSGKSLIDLLDFATKKDRYLEVSVFFLLQEMSVLWYSNKKGGYADE